MTSIAAIGNLCIDVVAEAPPRPGGTVFFSARVLARVGAQARIAYSCAARDKPLLAPALEALALPLVWHDSAETTAFHFRYSRTGRRVMRLEAVGRSWSPQDAESAVGGAEWVHVGTLVRTDFPRKTLAALSRERELLVDGQGLVRLPRLGHLRRDGMVGELLQLVTILKLDSEEAELLAGSADPERLARLGVPEVLLTLGPKGAAVIAHGRVEDVPPPDVPQNVDTIGAGDTFSAGYLSARAEGAEPEEAARRASDVVAEFLSGD